MERWIVVLTFLGRLLGGGVILYGLTRFWLDRTMLPLLISLAVVVAGPVEDLLKNRLHRGVPVAVEPGVQLVDAATSAVFLLLLAFAISTGGRATSRREGKPRGL